MQDSTEEIARQILASVLRQLEGGAVRQPRAPAANQAANQADADGPAGNPLIVIMLGDSMTTGAQSGAVNKPVTGLPAVIKQPGCGCQNNSHIAGGNSLQSSHPGLERFDLPESNTVSSAPRRCFIEPERVCVGSGACEMRGF